MTRKRNQILLIFSTCILSVLLAGCWASSQTGGLFVRPEQPNSIAGKVMGFEELWTQEELYIFAAQFTGDTVEQGYYVLEPELHPHAVVQKNGSFTILDVPEGKYILLIGPEPELALRLVDQDGNALMVEMKADEKVEVGKVFVSY